MTTDQETTPPKNALNGTFFIRALVAFLLMMAIFVCIEILPLHFGPKHLAFDQLAPEIKQRLPRMLLVGIIAAVVLAMGKKAPEASKTSEK